MAEINWGELYDMYAQAEENQRDENLAKMAEQDAVDKAYINDAFKKMEDEVYSKVEKGEKMDFSQTKTFEDLMKRFTQENTQVGGMPWERLLKNPEQSEREGSKDPWSQVMQRLADTQENANFQADFKKEAADWRQYQEDLAKWNKANQAYQQGQQRQGQTPESRAAQGINSAATARGGSGASWFYTPEGQAYLNGQMPQPTTTNPPAPGEKPTYTGNFGTSGSVAGKRNKRDDEPLF